MADWFVRCGWFDVAACLALACSEEGLDFGETERDLGTWRKRVVQLGGSLWFVGEDFWFGEIVVRLVFWFGRGSSRLDRWRRGEAW